MKERLKIVLEELATMRHIRKSPRHKSQGGKPTTLIKCLFGPFFAPSMQIQMQYSDQVTTVLSSCLPNLWLTTTWRLHYYDMPETVIPSFITTVARVRHLSLFCTTPIHSMTPFRFLKINFNIVLSSISRSFKLSLSLSPPPPSFPQTFLHTGHMTHSLIFDLVTAQSTPKVDHKCWNVKDGKETFVN